MPIPHVTLFMTFFDIQSSIQRKLFTNLSPIAREAYDHANANFRAARRSVASTDDCEASVAAESAELGRKRAAIVISAEQARANIVRAYEKQIAEGVDALTAAIDKRRGTTAVKVETVSDSKPSLASLLLAESAD
jgi:hypothetical protein